VQRETDEHLREAVRQAALTCSWREIATALGVLVEARSRLAADALLLAAPQLETRRTLQVTGLDRHLPVHDSVDDALIA
jgi:hypothetical protein